MSSSRHAVQFKANLAVAAGVMTWAAAMSLEPLKEDFIKQFLDRLDKPVIFHSQTTLSIAALRYFTKPLFADTHAAISKVADADLTTAMGWFVARCVKKMLQTGAISCTSSQPGSIAEEPAAGGTMVPSVMPPTAPVPDDNTRPTKRPRIDHTTEEKLGTTTVTVSHSLRAPHVRVYVTEEETRMVDASTQSVPATQDEEDYPSILFDGLRTEKLGLLRLARWFVNDYTSHSAEDPDYTLSFHVDCFLDHLLYDWDLVGNLDKDLDEDWMDDNRERFTMVIKALYS